MPRPAPPKPAPGAVAKKPTGPVPLASKPPTGPNPLAAAAKPSVLPPDDDELDLALDRLMDMGAPPAAPAKVPEATKPPREPQAVPIIVTTAAAAPVEAPRATPQMGSVEPAPAPPDTHAMPRPTPTSMGAWPAPSPQRAKNPSMTSVLPSDSPPAIPNETPASKSSSTSSSKASSSSSVSRRPKGIPRQPLTIGDNTQIDRFGLIREIARGGMGQVFLARDTKLGRKVAIKFLLHDDPAFAQRFLVEARATARVSHENIVAIYEVGEYEGLPYMVLEYLEGKTLSQVLEGKPGPKQFTEIMLAVARGLERAHEHGIVHRDLKPSNIFVTDRGQVKVLDFGVARMFDQPVDAMETIQQAHKNPRPDQGPESTYVTFTGGGTMVGTLPYMSPEQWGADTVDHQSDLWALGIMYWRALTGVHPAGTMNPDKLKARLTDLDSPLPSIGSRDPSLPRELVEIVDKALRKRKSERYQNAGEMLRDMQAFLAPTAQRIDADTCPYRGLAAFGESDAKYFFGRSNEIRTAVSQLETWPLLAVIGPSGVGKSSFVHAGLVPAVRSTGGNWNIRVLRPGREPLKSLANTLDDAIDTGQVLHDVIDYMKGAPGYYGELLRSAAMRRKHKVLIVVDQLEELFTLSDDDEIRKLFLAALLAAADDPTSPVRVVLSMRADFLDRLAGHKQFLAELSRGLFFLSAPDQDNLRETLVRPAELAGYTFEDDWLVEDMMQAATSKGALPLLQFAATRLWDGRDRGRRMLTIGAYNAMGGVGGAFARHADEVAAAVPSQSKNLLRAIMTRLVTAEGTRAVVDHDELLSLGGDRKEIERVLDHLVRSRLVLVHTDPAQGSTVEIVHEVLISEWPMLARWLEDSQALRGFMTELRTAVKQWVARGKANDLVWRGATAQEALALVGRHVIDLSSAEKEFLAEVKAQLSRARRRKAALVSAVIVVLLLVIGGGAFFTIQLQQANQAAQDKAAEAEKATKQVQAQLDQVRAAEAAREKAEAEQKAADERKRAAEAVASQATQKLGQSQEDLQKAYDSLKHEKEVADQEKLVAIENARKAAAAAGAEKKANEEVKAASKQLQVMLAREQERVKQLEAEKAKIATGGLK
ncbi:MAG: protein kinase domain-containing protein [Acidobacteriota bacterium]